MDDIELKAILEAKIQNSLGFQGGKLAKERQEAMKYYRGEPFGNEVDGRSQVVSRDVAEAVDSTMPALVKIFAGTDEVGKFEPQMPEDEDAASQSTDFVNYIYNQENEGFSITQTALMDGLLQKNGVAKSWWETQETQETENYQGLSEVQLLQLLSDPDIELVERSERIDTTGYLDPMQSGGPAISPSGAAPAGLPSAAPAMGNTAPMQPAPVPPMPAAPIIVHDVKVKRTNKTGRICIVNVPPEEFLIDRRAVSLETTPFCAHRFKRTVTDLLEEGYSKSVVDKLPGNDEIDYNLEKLERFRPEDEQPYRSTNTLDPAMREIWYCECYIKIALTGNEASWHRVNLAGGDSGYVILDKEEVDGHPFTAWTPNPQAHKFFGMSMADKTKDVQLIKSTVWRQTLDSLYINNTPQLGVVANQVNLDDLLTRRPGGVIRMQNPNAIVPIPTTPIAAEGFQMINYLDSVRESRTGIRRFSSSTDADALNPYNNTATGAQLIEDSSQDRILLMARNFAEHFMKPLFKRIFALTCKYQQKAKVIRLRGKWVEIDPSTWNTNMDFTVTVGLGTGNRSQQIQQQLMLTTQIDPLIVQAQGGMNGPILTWPKLYNQLEKLGEYMGHKTVEPFFQNPENAPPQQPQPNPELIKAQAQLELERQKAEQQFALKQQEAQQKAQIEIIQAQADIEVMRQKMAAEIAMKREEAAVTLELERQKAGVELQLKAEDVAMRAEDRRMAAQTAQKPAAVVKYDGVDEKLKALESSVGSQLSAVSDRLAQAVETLVMAQKAPRRLVRGPDGKAIGVETVG